MIDKHSYHTFRALGIINYADKSGCWCKIVAKPGKAFKVCVLGKTRQLARAGKDSLVLWNRVGNFWVDRGYSIFVGGLL